MKKLVIAAAITLSAVCSQAVSVNWSTGLLGAPTSKTDGTPTSTLISQTLGTWVATLYVYDAAGTTLVASDSITMTTYLNSSGKTRRSFSDSTKGSWSSESGLLVQTTLDDVAASTAYQWKLIVEGSGIDGDSTWTSSKEMDLQSITSAGAAVGTNINGGEVSGWTTQNWSAQSVPEPTSAMLLLLGMAGLALRRRRA